MTQFISVAKNQKDTWFRFTSAYIKNVLTLIAVFTGGLLFLGISLTALALILFSM